MKPLIDRFDNDRNHGLTTDRLDDDCDDQDAIARTEKDDVDVDLLGSEQMIATHSGNPRGRMTDVHNKHQALQSSEEEDDTDRESDECVGEHEHNDNKQIRTQNTHIHKSGHMNQRQRRRWRGNMISDCYSKCDYNIVDEDDLVKDAAVADDMSEED